MHPSSQAAGWHVILRSDQAGGTCSHLEAAPDVSAALAVALAHHMNDCGTAIDGATVERWQAGDPR